MSTPPFNQLTPAEVERLTLLAEECAEVIQAVGKIMRHGYESRYPEDGPTNRERLESELGDIDCAKALLVSYRDLNPSVILAASLKKREKLNRWLHHNSMP